GDKSPVLKHVQAPPPKREPDLLPAAIRGLALIWEKNLQDESSKVRGGGSIKTMNHNLSHLYNCFVDDRNYAHIASHAAQLQPSGTEESKTNFSSATVPGQIELVIVTVSHQNVASAQPVLTPAPLASTFSSSSLSTSAPCKAGLITAMAAGAAAAVAVASAAVKTNHGSISGNSSSSSGSQWKNVISSVMDQQHLVHYQQQQQKQAQQQLQSTQQPSQSQVQVQAQSHNKPPVIYNPVQE
ncbi:hypothetical protein BGZ74_003784, partial [Mortierella antarctica]